MRAAIADPDFDAERAETIRARSRWIWGVSIPVWITSLLFVDRAVFSAGQALAIRGPELVLAAVSWLWLRKPRRLVALEVWMVLAWAVVATLSGLGFLVIPLDKLPAKVASLELSALVVCLVGSLTWRANLVVAILAMLALSGLPVVGARELYTLSLTVVGFAYGVLVVSAAARDRLARAAHETRRALVVANDKLKREDELRRRLFVNLSHDFRTPLAVIRGDAAMLRTSEADREESLGRIDRNATALADLADQLLDLARLEAGQMPVRARPTDLGAVAREVAAQLGESRVVVTAAPAVARVDPAHAARILGNLVANALRQADRPVEVHIGRSGDVVRAEVVDEGPGVPPERREAIFTRFVSFDSDGSTASGIGLPLARELAVVNGGSLVLVDGTPKTTFRLELPATDEPAESPQRGGAPAVTIEPRRPVAAPGPQRRLLVVEDNDDMAALLSRALGDAFRVERAPRIADALRAIAADPPAAVLSDVMLPDGSGYDVLGAVRRRRDLDGVPVVLLSALGDPTERVRGLAAGADDYLPKPFDPDELRTRIASALERAEAWKKALDAQRDTLLMEVHDGVSASLARASILLETPDGVEHARDAIKDGLDEVRAITRLLAPRPTDFVTLASEIRRATADACKAAKLALDFEVSGEALRVPAAVAHTLRRVAREATTNIVKHACATTLRGRLRTKDGSFVLRVEDDGRGFPDEAGSRGQGLGIMSRRVARVGGTVVHGNLPGGGAYVEVELPGRPA